jgi:hypothetical protein
MCYRYDLYIIMLILVLDTATIERLPLNNIILLGVFIIILYNIRITVTGKQL